MCRALAILFGLGVALASVDASAGAPRVSARLDYSRGPGAETCPVDGSTLRAEVAARLGYDPFENSDARERVVVVISADKHRGWSARVERHNASNVVTFGPETFPEPPLRGGDCEALMSPLAAYVRSMLLSAGPPPEAQAPSPPPLAPAALPSTPPPEPLDVPNPARVLWTRVAIVSYVLAAVFGGLGIAGTVDAQAKGEAARALAAKRGSVGTYACSNGEAPSQYCADLFNAVSAQDTMIGLRNGAFVASGVSAAVGTASLIWALSLPATIKGEPRTRVILRPRGVVIQGTF